MIKSSRKIPLMLIVCLLMSGSGCILEEKEIELVFTDQAYTEFDEFYTTAVFATPTDMNLAEEMNEILDENGIAHEDLVWASVVSVSYGVTDFDHPHDWIISGSIDIERTDTPMGPDTILTYDTVSVAGALGRKIPAKLHRDGVSLLNLALADYIANEEPSLRFTVNNGDVIGDGGETVSVSDPIDFEWRVWLVLQAIIVQRVELPDPF